MNFSLEKCLTRYVEYIQKNAFCVFELYIFPSLINYKYYNTYNKYNKYYKYYKSNSA